MSLMKKIVLALMAAALLATFALETVRAQTDHSGHNTGAMSSTEAADAPASQAYKAAMDKMHSAMSAQKYTGDADVDFAVGIAAVRSVVAARACSIPARCAWSYSA